MDAALYRYGNRQRLPAAVLRAVVPAVGFDAAHVSAEPAASTRAILLDIEGTTTPIAFVFAVLFPYARTHLREHLLRHAADPALARIVDRLKAEHAADHTAGQPVPMWTDASADAERESAAVYVEWLMERDRKSTPLKAIQGRIWEEGYFAGELLSQVFDDVPPAFARWRAMVRSRSAPNSTRRSRR